MARTPSWFDEVPREPSGPLFSSLAAVPWSRLEHAYGVATDVPRMLWELTSADWEVADGALDGLFSSVWHQGTLCTASAAVVPFLRELWLSERRWASGAAASCLRALADAVPPTDSGSSSTDVLVALEASLKRYAGEDWDDIDSTPDPGSAESELCDAVDGPPAYIPQLIELATYETPKEQLHAWLVLASAVEHYPHLALAGLNRLDVPRLVGLRDLAKARVLHALGDAGATELLSDVVQRWLEPDSVEAQTLPKAALLEMLDALAQPRDVVASATHWTGHLTLSPSGHWLGSRHPDALRAEHEKEAQWREEQKRTFDEEAARDPAAVKEANDWSDV